MPPASPTPLLLAQLAGELGQFPGILNVISGPASLGPVLASQPGVQKVAFCGAIEVSSGRGGQQGRAGVQKVSPPLSPVGCAVPSGRTCPSADPGGRGSRAGPGAGDRIAAAADGGGRCGLGRGGHRGCSLVGPQPGEALEPVSPDVLGAVRACLQALGLVSLLFSVLGVASRVWDASPPISGSPCPALPGPGLSPVP